MAYVGAVYTIDRFRRPAEEVVDEIARRQRAADRPHPQHKQVWAEMTREIQGGIYPGREWLFGEMVVTRHLSDPHRQKTLICLMDGEIALWDMQRECSAVRWQSSICFTRWNVYGRGTASIPKRAVRRRDF